MKTYFSRFIIPAIILGSVLEYYDLGLVVYWTPLIGKVLQDISIPLAETVNTVLAIVTGLIARPLGAYLFGRSGDKHGRKHAFTWTIIGIALPTCLIGLPLFSFENWSLLAVIYIASMKFLQGIPAGGELPGAICFLAEESKNERDKILKCSFSLVGPQIGLLLSLAVVLLLQEYLSYETLLNQAWRIAFLSTGFLGIGGYLLRSSLHETREYNLMKAGHKIVQYPVRELFKNYRFELILAFSLSIFEVVAFCLLTVIPIIYFNQIFGLKSFSSLLIHVSVLIACIIFPPIFGKIASLLPNKIILLTELSAWSVIIFSPLFYYSIDSAKLLSTLIAQMLLVIFFSVQVAILPYFLVNLFPTHIRYSGIGFSFNVCDGILWGLVPIITNILISKTQNIASFVILFPLSAIIFLISARILKKHWNKYFFNI